MAKSSVPTNLDPDLVRDLALTRKKSAELPAKITTDEEQARIGSYQKTVHDLIKSIEAWYKRHTDPISKALTALREEKKALLAEPTEWNDQAERLLATYYVKREEAARIERDRLQRQLDREAEAARKQEVKALKSSGDKEAARELSLAPVIAPVAEVANTAALDGRSFRDELEITAVDLDLVPNEYLRRELNVAAIKSAYKNGIRDIPGVQIREIKTLVNRG
jgi:hypothetical protein